MLTAVLALAFAAAAAAAPEGNVLECMACEKVFTGVYNEITGNATEGNIEHALDHACEILPKGWLRGLCDGWINNHVNELIQEIKDRDTPEHICQGLGACANNTAPEPVVEEEEQVGGLFCPLCEGAIADLYSKWDNDTSKIDGLLDKICDIVPKDVRIVCDFEVNKEYAKIKNGIENHDSPSAICGDIGLCSKDFTPIELPTTRGGIARFVRQRVAHLLRHQHH